MIRTLNLVVTDQSTTQVYDVDFVHDTGTSIYDLPPPNSLSRSQPPHSTHWHLR